MSRGVSLFLWALGLPARRRLALVLAMLAVSLGLYPFVPFYILALYGLIVCLAVGALRRVNCALLEERQSAARLERAYLHEHALNEWKDQALQDLNHELRIPLTQTDGYLELLETYQGELDAATQARFIASARSGCEELLHLTRTAMETMQASGIQQPVHLSVFSLHHEVHTALAHCEPRLLQHHPVTLEIAESLLVYADERFVRQVMGNLLTNACKYTPAQTPIAVSAALMSAMDHSHGQVGRICVRVRDAGPGIPPEQQARLFQRFVRLPNATASVQPGSGLGLAICKQLVEAMGGVIWVESMGRDGEGCCFSFTLADSSQCDAPDHVKRYGESDGKAQARVQNQQENFAVSALQWSG